MTKVRKSVKLNRTHDSVNVPLNSETKIGIRYFDCKADHMGGCAPSYLAYTKKQGKLLVSLLLVNSCDPGNHQPVSENSCEYFLVLAAAFTLGLLSRHHQSMLM